MKIKTLDEYFIIHKTLGVHEFVNLNNKKICIKCFYNLWNINDINSIEKIYEQNKFNLFKVLTLHNKSIESDNLVFINDLFNFLFETKQLNKTEQDILNFINIVKLNIIYKEDFEMFVLRK